MDLQICHPQGNTSSALSIPLASKETVEEDASNPETRTKACDPNPARLNPFLL